MRRRSLLRAAVAAALWPLGARAAEPGAPKPLACSRDAWRKVLRPEAYAVLFEAATERPNSSPLVDEHRDGTFVCAACKLPLFESSAKFDSGTGWPSFTRAIAAHVGTQSDWKLLVPRTEYHCARCGGHQGHVFDDGPPPTGKRWCNNGVALEFVAKTDGLPALRDCPS